MTTKPETAHLMGEDDPVGDPYEFMQWLGTELNLGSTIAIDTETTGLKWWTPRFTRLVQFGTAHSGWAIPVDWYGKVIDHALSEIRKSGCRVAMHNANFDMHALESDGFPVPDWMQVEDTELLHRIVRPGAFSHGLKPACKEEFGSWAGRGQEGLKAKMHKNGWDWSTVPVDLEEYWGYGVLDTCLTAMLFDHLHPLLDDRQDLAYEREMRYRAIMHGAEQRGLRVDQEYTTTLRHRWEDEINAKRGNLKLSGIDNPNSNRQVEAAFADLGVEFFDFTKTGQAKLDKVVLARIEEFGGPAGATAKTLVEYKQLTKWKGTYLSHFIDDLDGNGKLHPFVRTMGAKTGRSSITDPPMQTLPSGGSGGVIRRCIIPDEGHHLCSIDYAGQEARIFASYANEHGMIEELSRPDGDLHNYVANIVFGDGFTKAQRSIAKTVNFALIYGAGPAKMATSAGVTLNEIEMFLSRYHTQFPGVKKFMSAVEQVGKGHLADDGEAWVRTSGGRKVVAEGDQTYALTNYLIQGSGADVLKDAVIRLDNAGFGDTFLLPVHDEILFQFPDGFDQTSEVAELMADRDTFRVPLPVDVSPPLTNWGAEYV